MLKVSYFRGHSETGINVIPLFGKADAEFEKCASSGLLPDVTQYIGSLRPSNGSQYVLVNAMGASEWYGCFPAGTLVETLSGEKPIEQVEPGEQVRTYRNRFKPVLARIPKEAGELCDLYVQGLPSVCPALVATPNHELWVVTREEFLSKKRKYIWNADTELALSERRRTALQELEFSWIPISDLQVGDMVAEPFPLEEDPAALGDECWNSPEVAYLMGLYAAEGCVAYRYDREDDRPYKIVYITGQHEVETHQKAQSCAMLLGHQMSPQHIDSTHSTRLELCSTKLAGLCLEHIGSPAVNKRLSSSILRMPRGWQEVFFTAYAAGDGYTSGPGKSEGTVRCVSASAGLLHDFRLLLARLGFIASINGRHNRKASWYNGNPIYELSLSSGQFSGRSCSKSYLHPGGFILSSVKRVKQYSWVGKVYDLTVEEDSSFVANGIVVHNSNVNGDAFPEASLVHIPDNWSGVPVIDKVVSKNWDYGFPTFYNAHPYAHHRNKDSSKAFGDVELATWNPDMKRVELVIRVDHDKCQKFGGESVWDKLRIGEYPDVSMGTKVPYDTCSICLDWDLYREAEQSNSSISNTGQRILAFHKKLKAKNGIGIRGLSITRDDYCVHAKKHMNRILPDGRKVWVFNDYPRFFDISFVFIGADKTAKVMLFIYRNGQTHSVKPSAQIADEMGLKESSISEGPLEKAASIDEELLKAAFGKLAKPKRAEIIKDIVPSQFVSKAIPVLTRHEHDIPEEMLEGLAKIPEKDGLSTLAGMGVVLKPREFQRTTLIRLGKKDLADQLDDNSEVFSKSDSSTPVDLSTSSFRPGLAELLLPLLLTRSALGPVIEKRVVISFGAGSTKEAKAASHSQELLHKVASAYNGYRHSVMELVAHSQDLLSGTSNTEMRKLASASAEQIFTPLSVAYLQHAFMEEFGISDNGVVK